MPVLERRWEGDAFCAETITKFATNVTLTTKHSQCYNYYFPFIFSGLANMALFALINNLWLTMMVVDVVIILAMLIMKDSSSQDKQLQIKMVVVTKRTMTKTFFSGYVRCSV